MNGSGSRRSQAKASASPAERAGAAAHYDPIGSAELAARDHRSRRERSARQPREVSSYEAFWARIRRRWIAFFVLGGGIVPVQAISRGATFRLEMTETVPNALFWMQLAAAVTALVAAAMHRCPRCGKSFNRSAGSDHGPIAQRCIHCHLGRGARFDPDAPSYPSEER